MIKTYYRFGYCLSIILLLLCPFKEANAQVNQLKAGFIHPPDSAKPRRLLVFYGR